MEPALQFQPPTGDSPAQPDEILAGSFTLSRSSLISHPICFYDTFDWRLFGKSLVLEQGDGEIRLRRLSDGFTITQLQIDSLPDAIEELPDGALKDSILPIVVPRALLRLNHGQLLSRSYRVLNTDQKTVAYLVFHEFHPASMDHKPVPKDLTQFTTPHATIQTRSPAFFLELQPVRGYRKESQRLVKLLKNNGFTQATWQDFYTRALKAAGVVPGSYTTKITISLDPKMRADQATRLILTRLLEVIKANEAGIRADIDPEFLHDFRVAIRRTRSALSQVQEIFSAKVTERFRQDFSILGSFTNQLRDLDVYLLAENDYKSLLPANMRQDINPLFDLLRSRRSQALQDVITFMDSAEYTRILQDWQDFLAAPITEEVEGEEQPPANAAVTIIKLSSRRIRRWYWRVIEDGNDLVSNPEDTLMHALRIKCKKLRYLIEFFESLYPPDKVSVLVSQLKKLQDNLGEFNDLSVQQAYLINLTEQLPLNQEHNRQSVARALVATGSLVNSLSLRREEVRSHFAETFAQFASTQNQDLVRELFGKSRRKRHLVEQQIPISQEVES